MNLRRLQYRLRRSLADRGVTGTAALALRKTLSPDPTPSNVELQKEFQARHPFDSLHGVETSGLVFPEDLPSGRRSDLYNNGYFGIAPSVFRQILTRLEINFRNYTFVDLGSGKGRALLLASAFPFREIVGVELSPKLHATAQENVARYRPPGQRCSKIECIQGDAAEYRFPEGPFVLYMWNAFEGPVFEKAVSNLEASLERAPREAYVLYVHPELDRRLTTSPFLRRLWCAEFEMSEEDYAAYAFPPRAEICTAYRSVLRQRD